MTNRDIDFDTWFDLLRVNVLERTGEDFRDKDSLEADYESGTDLYDIVEEIEQTHRELTERQAP